jgi:nitrous oxide reductase accessory protein NosL
MCDHHDPQRRGVLKAIGALGLTGFAGSALADPGKGPGAMMPGKGWMPASGESCPGDGTPLQFIPRGAPDADPLTDELTKYPVCPYCGMNRTKFNHSRHLVQYDDDLVDGTCSIHCLAISLALNLDRGPKAIYAADFGSTDEIKPLVAVDDASYLVGSGLKGTMSAVSKMAFADQSAAEQAQAANGGELMGFDEALRATYVGMADDTVKIRQRRAERRAKMAK